MIERRVEDVPVDEDRRAPKRGRARRALAFAGRHLDMISDVALGVTIGHAVLDDD